MINTAILERPFVMIFAGLELLEIGYHTNAFSQIDMNKLHEIVGNLFEVNPKGRISDLHYDKFKHSTSCWDISAITNDIRRLMTYDDKKDYATLDNDLFHGLTMDEHVAKYISIFEPLSKKLKKHHQEKLKIISEGINA